MVLPAAPTGRVLEQPFKAKLSADRQQASGHARPAGLGGNDPAKPAWGRWFRHGRRRCRAAADVADERRREPAAARCSTARDAGRVALLLSDHAWLWARGYEGGGPHTDLLRRLAHWLMKEPDLEEERLLASTRGLKLTIERRSMEDSVPVVQLSAPGGETTDVTLDKAGPDYGAARSMCGRRASTRCRASPHPAG